MDLVWLLGGLIFGILCIYFSILRPNQKAFQELKYQHREELRVAEQAAYIEGWEACGNDVSEVLKNYQRHFEENPASAKLFLDGHAFGMRETLKDPALVLGAYQRLFPRS
jgi:hypothetical protein